MTAYKNKTTWRRKSDGELWELLTGPIDHAIGHAYRFVRVGPLGKPRFKRTWVLIDDWLRDFEEQPAVDESQSDDAVARGVPSEHEPSTRVKGI